MLQTEKFNARSMWSANGFNKAPQSFNIPNKTHPPPGSAITATDGDNTAPEPKQKQLRCLWDLGQTLQEYFGHSLKEVLMHLIYSEVAKNGIK